MYENKIAERLTYLRMAKGVSAREMSLSIGQNCSYINRIENRKAMPSMQVFLYICEYLGVTPAEFFNFDGLSNSSILMLAKEMEELDPEQIDLVKNIIADLKKMNK